MNRGLVGALVTATLLLVAGCPAQPAGGGGGGASSAAASSGGAGGATASIASSSSGPVDPNWPEAPWAPPECNIQMAADPKSAVPPLQWDPCTDGSVGCSQLNAGWVTDPLGTKYGSWGSARFAPDPAGGYRIGLGALRNFDPSVKGWAMFFDGALQPVLVLRAPYDAQRDCYPGVPIATPTRGWFGALRISPTGAVTDWYGDGEFDALTQVSDTIPDHTGAQAVEANDDVLTMQPLGAYTTVVYDRLSGTSDTIGSGTRIPTMAFPARQSAFLVTSRDAVHWEGWVWNHATHKFEVLVSRANKAVLQIRSDGDWVSWMEAPPADETYGVNPAGVLWTSPFATKASELVPRKLRSMEAVAIEGHNVSANGFYTNYDNSLNIHVVRLEDGRHWQFPVGVGLNVINYVDATYVFYSKNGVIYRQAMSALGPGD